MKNTLDSNIPQVDTQPDTRVNTRPRTPFSVGLIYIYLSKE